MAEVVRKGRMHCLRLIGKLFASVLGFAGVLSSACVPVRVDYGPPEPALCVYGRTFSAEDSSSVIGLDIKLTSPDSLVNYGSDIAYDGYFSFYLESADYTPWPDSLRLIATDIDGELNGSFAEKDTILLPDINEEYIEFNIDLHMLSDNN